MYYGVKETSTSPSLVDGKKWRQQYIDPAQEQLVGRSQRCRIYNSTPTVYVCCNEYSMPTKFQPVIRRVRVARPGLNADSMARLGNALNNSIKARMDRAQDIYDQPAPALTPGYAKYKAKGKYHGNPVRDLQLTGQTRRSMRLLSAQQNRAYIGFSDPVGKNRMQINNRRSRQYGASPADMAEVMKQLKYEVLISGNSNIQVKAG